jgi:hypothetical protein
MATGYPREARDFAGDLFERMTRQERTFIRDWGAMSANGKREELLVSVGSAKETKRTEITCASVLADFNELKGVLPTCATPNQILNMEETLLSASPMKGKKRDIILVKIGTVL